MNRYKDAPWHVKPSDPEALEVVEALEYQVSQLRAAITDPDGCRSINARGWAIEIISAAGRLFPAPPSTEGN